MELEETATSLLSSAEPAVRYRVRLGFFGESPDSMQMVALRQEIRRSPRVTALLSDRGPDGTIAFHPYAKWYGAHWVLVCLADLGYPPGDEMLTPLREQVLAWLLSESHARNIPTIKGLVRRCASQEGNALYALLALGLADSRCDELASRLRRWQWPDGGWNCDRDPAAHNSSFMESLIPMRALAWHARVTGDRESASAAARASEIFLKRRLYRTQRDGSIIASDFVRLHYPWYWHYDILFALTVLAEVGLIADPRCRDALDLLESRRLPAGGWPADAKYYTCSPKAKSGSSRVDWGGASPVRCNEFVTAHALCVLGAAGRA